MIVRAGERPSATRHVTGIAARREIVDGCAERATHRQRRAIVVHRRAAWQPIKLLRRVGQGRSRPALDAYRAHGGYRALARAFELGPAGVVQEVIASNLLGRGGAAFPTGRKWEAVAREPARPHFLVCNADESEPGTFKDRVLLEEDPFALVEAMTIAALATGCEHGLHLHAR